MAVINTNVNAIIARNAGAVNERSMTNAMQQLSTGKRINVAADDAAGLAISTKMTAQIRGLDQAVRNANDGISMLQVVEGATVEMTNMLQRMRELAVQSSNDTNTTAERSYLNDEYSQLKNEIDRIAKTTQWNGVNVMDGSAGIGNDTDSDFVAALDGQMVSFQVGANADANQKIKFQIASMAVSTGSSSTTPATIEMNFGSMTDAKIDAIKTIRLTNGATNYDFSVASLSGTPALSTINDSAAAADSLATKFQALVDANTNLSGITVTSAATGQLNFSDSQARTWTVSYIDATPAAITAAVGDTPQETITAGTAASAGADVTTGVFKVGTYSGAVALNSTNILTASDSSDAILALDNSLTALNEQRSAMGATINRLTYAADNLTNTSANTTAARSRVLDTDYAQATTELARTQIIQQASTAMLAQANQGAQSVLSLLK